MTTALLLAALLGMGGIEAKGPGPTAAPAREAPRIAFPEPSAETRPWGICHLMGNAVEKAELAKEMHRWSEAGLGGVRLVPIYAAKGNDGRNIATLSPAFGSLLKDANALAAANGLKVNRKGVEWKNFEDINMVGIDYKPLDASSWPVQPSGLIGPVKMELWD